MVAIAGELGRLVMGLILATGTAQQEAGPVAEGPPQSSTPDLASDAEVLERFLARPDEPVRSFRARRHLEITGGLLKKTAWMDVLVELDADRGFRYAVMGSGGSEMLQNKILRRVLDMEQEVYAAGGNAKAALTAQNYAFAPCGRHETGLVCLAAKARRKEVGLLNGRFLVTPDAGDLVEVSGTMAKAPTFWIPQVDITKRYARIQGHRVNVSVESVSHVRFLGLSRFTMRSAFEVIDGDVIATTPDVAQPSPHDGGSPTGFTSH